MQCKKSFPGFASGKRNRGFHFASANVELHRGGEGGGVWSLSHRYNGTPLKEEDDVIPTQMPSYKGAFVK